MLVKKAGSATITAAGDATTDAVAVIDSNPTTEVEDATTDVEGVTASNPTTAGEDAMTAEAVETASAPKDTEGTDNGLAIGTVPSATT